MQLAVSALLLLLLLLPGFIFQLSYTKGLWRWNSPVVMRPVTEIIPSSIILAIVLHLIWAPLASFIGTINLNVLMMFLLGNFGHDEQFLLPALNVLSENPYKIAIYFLSLNAASAILGYLLHMFIRSQKIDHEVRSLRFNNEWFYWLSGEIVGFCDTKNVDGNVEGVYLSAVVHHGQDDYLYTGFVIDWYFDKDGTLDRIVLDKAMRRKLDDDASEGTTTEERYYAIQGNYLVMRYSELSTLNLQYLTGFDPNAAAVPPSWIIRGIRFAKSKLHRGASSDV